MTILYLPSMTAHLYRATKIDYEVMFLAFTQRPLLVQAFLSLCRSNRIACDVINHSRPPTLFSLHGTVGFSYTTRASTRPHVCARAVVDRIYISRTEDEKIFVINVEKVAFLPDGEWMATSEYRNDGEVESEVRLKFWRLSGTKYNLNTSADVAHRGRITSLTAHPHEPVFVTTGHDGTFKAWALQAGGGVKDQVRALLTARSPRTAALVVRLHARKIWMRACLP
jgi:WD40 repeat protein